MGKVTFTCETITPMFMYGANQSEPELRAASIKGVMRFWWRAIHGSLKTIKELHDEESKIFGSTDKKSSFSVKIKHHKFQSNQIPKNHSFTIEFLNHGTFDIQSFFELVVLLGGFGKSAKKIDQGKIRILTIQQNDKKAIAYTQPNNLNDILSLLNSINQAFELKDNKIVSQNFNFNYPMIHKIWIDNNTLNTKLNTKLKEEKIFKRSLNG